MRGKQVCVIGMGRVGLTLSLVLAAAGFKVLGVERNQGVVAQLNSGQPHFYEKGLELLLKQQIARNLTVREEIGAEQADVFIVCIGTPVDPQTRKPLLADLLRGVGEMVPYLRPGNLVILRSTVPVGVTRQQVWPLISQRVSQFYLAFCPERTAEGKALEELRELPQIIGALDPESEEQAVALFSRVTTTIVRVSSLEAAEAIKLLDNSYRDIHFAYANEVALICERLGLDAVELIRAANLAYPRNRIPVPGLVGGTCLSKDPYLLLASVAGQSYNSPSLIQQARELNQLLPSHVARRAADALSRVGKEIARAKILVAGLAFKGQPETDDLRNSPSLSLAAVLRQEYRCQQLCGHDFAVPAAEISKAGLEPVSLEQGFTGADAVIFTNNHRCYYDLDILRLAALMNKPPIIWDCWHIFNPKEMDGVDGIIYGGLGVG